mmetsp:Transcript_1185/g.3274  ORF Transcript_1185/g.3274 Transcript_1185/m.3274 type:complete len:86 (+) Transcript_1185:682-939(+)
MEDFETRSAAWPAASIHEARKMQYVAPSRAPAAFRPPLAVFGKLLNEPESILGRHVDVDVMLPPQKATGSVPHSSKECACSQSIA